jgi:hypothetical protein
MAVWDERVKTALDKQFPNEPHQKAIILGLWEKYAALKLPNHHFVSELTSGNKAKVFQRNWEMLLARHLDALGYKVNNVSKEGPDFWIEHEGKKIWIEAICPTPQSIPQHWLEHPKPGSPIKVHDVPHNEVLLRWTAAVKEKREKLEIYLRKKIVGTNDAYVIAVNGCQLGAWPPERGTSQFPYALEAVFPVGELTIPIDRATGAVGKPFYLFVRRSKLRQEHRFQQRCFSIRQTRPRGPTGPKDQAPRPSAQTDNSDSTMMEECP